MNFLEYLGKVMYASLIRFLEVNIIFIQHLFGFRNKCSTHMVLGILMDKLIKSSENGDYMICEFHDFSKAYDTVDHKNIERHTTHTIVSLPNPKQWVKIHTSDLMMKIRQSKYILSTSTKEMI